MNKQEPHEKNIIITFSITFLIMVGVLVSALALYPNSKENIAGASVAYEICTQNHECNDQNECTYDECIQGSCTHRNKVCNDGNPITINSCNPKSGCTFV